MRRSLPSGRNVTIVPLHLDVGTQWSHDADTPITSRPSGARTTLLFSPPATGPPTITRLARNRRPSKSPYEVTRPSELTIRRSPAHTSPSGASSPPTIFTGFAPGRATRKTPSLACVDEPDVVAQRRPAASNVSADTCDSPRA